MLKQLLALLAQYVPTELLFQGTAAAVVVGIVVLAFYFFKLLGKAAEEVLSDAVKAWFRKDSRGPLLFIVFGLLALASAAAARPATAALMALLGIIGVFFLRKKRRFPIPRLAAIVLIVFPASIFLEGWLIDRQLQDEAKRVTVYVVLPFQPSHTEDAQTRLNVSKLLLGTIGGIFRPIADVKVEPATFNAVQDLDEWGETEAVARRLQRRGVWPDVMLNNLGSVVDDPADGTRPYLNLLVWPSFAITSGHGRMFEKKRAIAAAGRLHDIDYLAIRTSLELVSQLKQLPGKPLTAPNEASILRNVVTAYLAQLQTDGAASVGGAGDAAQAALDKPALTLEQVRVLIHIYPPDEEKNLKEIYEARAMAATGKLAQSDQPQPQSTSVVQPAPAVGMAPPAKRRAPGTKS